MCPRSTPSSQKNRSPKLTRLRPLHSVSATEFNFLSANIVSTYQAGCFFGALLGYPAGQFLGRKNGLLLTSIVFCVGAGIMLAANGERGLGPIYGGRILAGIGIGAASNLTPLYVSPNDAFALSLADLDMTTDRRDRSSRYSWSACRHVRDWMADWRTRRFLE